MLETFLIGIGGYTIFYCFKQFSVSTYCKIPQFFRNGTDTEDLQFHPYFGSHLGIRLRGFVIFFYSLLTRLLLMYYISPFVDVQDVLHNVIIADFLNWSKLLEI